MMKTKMPTLLVLGWLLQGSAAVAGPPGGVEGLALQTANDLTERSFHGPGGEVREIRRIVIGGPGRAVLGIRLEGGPEGGALVAEVVAGGPAEAAGVKSGDLIVALDGNPITQAADVLKHMADVRPGSEVRLAVRRGESEELVLGLIAEGNREVEVHALRGLGASGMPGHLVAGHRGFLPPQLGPGLRLAAMNEELGQYFGTAVGVLLLETPAGGAATGLQAGDVILAIGGRKPEDPDHAMRILGSYQPGETVSLQIKRKGKALQVEYALPKAPVMEWHELLDLTLPQGVEGG